MSSFRRDKKEEEDGGTMFTQLEKTAILQEARKFNNTTVNPRQCTSILMKLLYLLNQGEQLTVTEATDVFFAMTKLFQSKDVVLRRMVYLGIKELSSVADDVIIVTSSLTKDMTGKEDIYRSAAIRALCTITDGSMLQAIERYMKQAVVDRNAAVSSAALVSSLHLTKMANEVVKRWVNEAQEAVNSDNIMVQYHALGLLYHIRKSDRLAVTKLVGKLTSSSLKSPYAVCMLIRITAKLLEEEDDTPQPEAALNFLTSCLRHKSEMVMYEAAHAIVNSRKTTSREIAPAISILQLFCSSPKATLRFAAVRTLNQIAINQNAAVTGCNLELENLITDSNRSIATLAITTLLKTGAESSVDRLMKQIASFVSEISDEFKVVVVQAIRALGLKYPRKHSVLMNFLSAMLREEGGLDYKASIADTIITIIEDNPDSKDTGLAHLCEFIEDCEHISLAVRILHLLGKEGPKTKQPYKYIRFIYNRVLLERAPIRGAAVAALAKFGALCPDLLPNILVLLQRCQMDSDDEVRDRATYYSRILSSSNAHLYDGFILEPLQVSIPALEKSLKEYTFGEAQQAFDIKTVPLSIAETVEDEKSVKINTSDGVLVSATKLIPETRQIDYYERICSLPGIVDLGPIFKSSEVVELTEPETEYLVRCIKHSFARYLVLQFDCLNTLAEQILQDVRIQIDPSDGYRLIQEFPISQLVYNSNGTAFVVLEYPNSDLGASIGTFGAVLKFTVKGCNPENGALDPTDGYLDEYMLEDLEVTLADQMQPLAKVNWGPAWTAAEETHFEREDTYCLSALSSLEEAVSSVVQFLGLGPCERSDKIAEGKSTHTLLLAGVFRGGVDIMARAKLALSDGVTMQLTVRASHEEVADLITSTVG